jgi:hypothetical protein
MARGSLPHQRVCSQWWVILGPRRAVALRTEPTHHPAAQASPAHRQPLRAYGPKPPAYERRRRPRPGVAAVCSCLGAVAQVHHAVAESARRRARSSHSASSSSARNPRYDICS